MKSMVIVAVLAFLAVASAKPFLGELGAGLGEVGAGLGAGLGNIGAGLGAGIGAGLEAYKWAQLGIGYFSHGEDLSINHHACSMRVNDFKLIIRNYKARFPHDVLLHRLGLGGGLGGLGGGIGLGGLGGGLGLGVGESYGSGGGYGQSGYAGGSNGYGNSGYGGGAVNVGHDIGHQESDFSQEVHHHQSSGHDVGGAMEVGQGGHNLYGHNNYGAGQSGYGQNYNQGGFLA
uniref:SFRICE_027963 n=1 Tax=Spodoptera frugiperda TaxID=7108 RepID=A0A2H1W051_SPOFR